MIAYMIYKIIKLNTINNIIDSSIKYRANRKVTIKNKK